jgi:hypothetical protein
VLGAVQTARISRKVRGCRLGENFTSALFITTDEFTQVNPKRNGSSADRQVGQGTLIEAMDFGSKHLAGGASAIGLSGHQAKTDGCLTHLLLGELKLVGQNERQIHGLNLVKYHVIT